MNVRNIVVAVIAMAVFQSCALLGSRFEVVSFSPAAESVPTVDGVQISIRFNTSADPVRVENAFSVTADGSRVGGRIEWLSERELRFVPTAPLKEYRRYEVVIGVVAESEDGVNLNEEFVHEFSSKSDTTRPELVSLVPADGATLFERRPGIVARFTEPLSRETALAGVSIAPSVRVRTDFSESDSVMTLTPLEDLSWGETYTVTVSSSVSDFQRNTLGEEQSNAFTMGDDISPPVLLSATAVIGSVPLVPDDPNDAVTTITAGISRTSAFLLSFDEAVDVSSVQASLSIQPNAAFEIANVNTTLQQNVTVRFPSELEFDTRYTMTLASGVGDGFDNRTDGSSVFIFETDDPTGRPPEVVSVHFQDDPSGTSFVPLNAFATLPLGNYDSADVAAFDVLLRSSPGSTFGFFDLTDVFSFSVTGGAASFQLIALEIAPTGSPAPPVTTGPDETLVRLKVIVEDLNRPGTVRFTVRSGLRDTASNALPEDFELLLNKGS